MKALALKICDNLKLFGLFNAFTKGKAAVFMMHHFCESGARDFRSLPADRLEDFLKYLAINEYQAISLSEFVTRLIDNKKLYKNVVFTVDDGYRDFLLHGFPVFSKYRIPVAVFLTTDFVNGKLNFWWDIIREIIEQTRFEDIKLKLGEEMQTFKLSNALEKESAIHRIIEHSKKMPPKKIDTMINRLKSECDTNDIIIKKNALEWEDIVELDAQGVEFYPHTCKHPILSQCSDSEITNEIYESKKVVSNYLKKASNIFCYPNGRNVDFDDRSIKILKNAGFVAAFTSEEGLDRSGGKLDMFRLHRYSLSDDLLRFKQIVSGLESMKISMRSAINGIRKN